MKKSVLPALALTLLFAAPMRQGSAEEPQSREVLFQVSLINALLEGAYDGIITCGELRSRGDIGIGTFDKLDGEMVVLEGSVYKVRADGAVVPVPDAETVPFACATWFEPDIVFEVESVESLAALQRLLDGRIGAAPDLFYAVRIDGEFGHVKTRSVPPQQKPYPRLVEVVKKQSEFESDAVKGTLAGVWCPAFSGGLNVAGYHLHFLSADRKFGGHVLDCRIVRAKASLDATPLFMLQMPAAGSLGVSGLEGDRESELKAVEQ